MRASTIAVFVSIMALAGCHTAPSHSWHRDGWRGFSYGEAEQCLKNYKNVMLVCITADYVEDLDPAKPASWSVLCFEGTVVRKYKGDWEVGERLQFARALDSRVEKQNNARVGELMFLFTNAHTNTEFGVDTGEFERYLPQTDRLLRSLFPDKRTETAPTTACSRRARPRRVCKRRGWALGLMMK